MNLVGYKDKIRVGGFVRLKKEVTLKDLNWHHIWLPINGAETIEILKANKFVVKEIEDEHRTLILENTIWVWPARYFDPAI